MCIVAKLLQKLSIIPKLKNTTINIHHKCGNVYKEVSVEQTVLLHVTGLFKTVQCSFPFLLFVPFNLWKLVEIAIDV